MIRPSAELAAFERTYARERGTTYLEALGVFSALWAEAALLNPDFPPDWRQGIQADLAVARTLNGLPSAP